MKRVGWTAANKLRAVTRIRSRQGARIDLPGSAKGTLLRPAILLAALALTGCATTRFVPVHCVTKSQLEQLKRAEPPKVGQELTGQAQDDLKIIAGSNVKLRAYGHGLLGVLEGCAN